MHDLLITDARIVPITHRDRTRDPQDLLIRGGEVVGVGPVGSIASPDAEIIEAGGRYVIPGLWDHHVHASQWARAISQLDTSGTRSAEEVVARVAERLRSATLTANEPVFGWGHRSASWHTPPTVAQLDAVSGGTPVVLVSGDGHHGWLNTAALTMLGVPPRDTVIEESEWFPVFGRLDELRTDTTSDAGAIRDAVARANSLGVVGITDLEFGRGWERWAEWFAAGIDTLRVRPGTYAETLEDVISLGLRTGDAIPGTNGMVRMGPLKIISDGSLNTRTAWCRHPYSDAAALRHPAGAPNLPVDALRHLFARGHEAGLEIACHAIGDAAVEAALDAFEMSGADGGIEHAQLTTHADITRMARLGVHASVQPAHLWDDRDVTSQCWTDRTDECFMLRTMIDTGVRLTMGSDAPVSPLNPWVTMAAAVHRSGDDRDPWNPGEAITAREALRASTNGAGTVGPGSLADLVLVDRNPLGGPVGDTAALAEHLLETAVAATIVNGRVVHTAMA